MGQEDRKLLTAIAWSVLVGALAVAVGSTFTWGLQEAPPQWFQPFLDHVADWFVAVFTGLLAYVTYRLVQSTNKLWESDEKRFALEQRPWLQVTLEPRANIHDTGRLNPEPEIRIVVEFTVQNIGKTPAFYVIATADWDTIDQVVEIKRRQQVPPQNQPGDTMFPGEKMSFNFDLSKSRKEIEKFIDPLKPEFFFSMVIIVNVHYRDGTDKSCLTRLVYSFNASTSRAPSGDGREVTMTRRNADTIAT